MSRFATLFLLSSMMVAVNALCGQATLGGQCMKKDNYGQKIVPPTADEIKEILKAHNYYRNKVATGKEVAGGDKKLPEASDMVEMEWNNKLAAKAQEWANMCIVGHDDKPCRKKGTGFSYVGQNAASKTASEGYDPSVYAWNVPVDMWYEEVKDYYGDPSKFTDSGGVNPNTNVAKVVGHFTQVIWADSAQVGCGKAQYRYKTNVGTWVLKKTRRVYICNYGEGGNIKGKAIYKKGPAASACPAGTQKSNTYPGLCKKRG